MRKRPDFIWTPGSAHKPVRESGRFLSGCTASGGRPERVQFRQNSVAADRRQSRPGLGRGRRSLPDLCEWPAHRPRAGAFQSAFPGVSTPTISRARCELARTLIAVLVHCYGVDTGILRSTKGMWQPSFGDGGLWLEGHAQCGDARVAIEVRTRMALRGKPCVDQDVPRFQSLAGLHRRFRCRSVSRDNWTLSAFDDSAWEDRTRHAYGRRRPEAPYGGIETRPFPILLPRVIPPFIKARNFRSTPSVSDKDPRPTIRNCRLERRMSTKRGSSWRRRRVKSATISLKRKERPRDSAERAGERDFPSVRLRSHHERAIPSSRSMRAAAKSVEIACAEGFPGGVTDGGIAERCAADPASMAGQ